MAASPLMRGPTSQVRANSSRALRHGGRQSDTHGATRPRPQLQRCAASPAGAPDSEGQHQKKQQQQQDLPSTGAAKSEGTRRVPVDTPLRKANRDIMYGVLTIRAVRTLVTYLRETNLHLAGWLVTYMNQNPIVLSGSPEEASGSAFIKKMLSMPVQQAIFDNGIDPMHRTTSGCHVDPRSMAQRILAVREQLATEFKQDMLGVLQDNEDLVQRCNRSALERSLRMVVAERTLPVAEAAVNN